MRTPFSVRSRPEILVGLLCGIAGVALSGVEASLLWFVVGYFAGKSAQSVLLTVRGGRAT